MHLHLLLRLHLQSKLVVPPQPPRSPTPQSPVGGGCQYWDKRHRFARELLLRPLPVTLLYVCMDTMYAAVLSSAP
jgi:hypothetical protein